MNRMHLVLILLLGCQALTVVKLLRPSSDIDVSTMPILTPVSLDYEKAFRSGQEPINLHIVMDAARHVDPDRVPKAEYEQFSADRLKMLELRNQRHALNVRLMEAGVDIVQRLTPEQWEIVQSQRDKIQADEEAKMIETILQKWSK
mgnify:CR=1 FL=1